MMILSINGHVMAQIHQQKLGDHEIRDLELFTTHNGSPGLFSYLDYTHSECGKRRLKKLIKRPTTNGDLLKQRQQAIQELLENKALQERVEQGLEQYSLNEPYLNQFWQEPDQLKGLALKEFYYQNGTLKRYNKSPIGLDVGQVLYVGNLFLPVLEHFVLHFFISEKLQDKLGFTCAAHPHGHGKHDHCDHNHSQSTAARVGYQVYNAAHMGIHLMGLKGLYDHIRQKNRILLHMQQELIGVRNCLDSALELLKVIEENQVLSLTIPSYNKLKQLFEQYQKTISPELKQFLKLISSRTFKGQPSFFSRSGNILAAYHLMYEVKDELYSLLQPIGELDAYLSCAYVMHEHKDTQTPYCFVEYLDSTKPILSAKQFWNPFLANATPNSIELGVENRPRSIVITGPNKGGKSTAMKALAESVVLGQTIGMAPAQELALTPFTAIKTAMNITDDIVAGESLFSACVNRAQTIIASVKTLPEKQFAFIALDELFNSTVFETGQDLSYKMLNFLGRSPNTMVMAATHFPKLTELADVTDSFSNYCVQPHKNAQNRYKLVPGIASMQSILELMPDKDILGLGLAIA
jgi:DNA mismatch repair protein MutS